MPKSAYFNAFLGIFIKLQYGRLMGELYECEAACSPRSGRSSNSARSATPAHRWRQYK
nr:MAG TPA: hypothetical protein [Caudoviricetes sp.]